MIKQLFPTAVAFPGGADDTFTASGSADKAVCVQANDGDTTHIYAGPTAIGWYEKYVMQVLSGAASLQSVTEYGIWRHDGGATSVSLLIDNGTAWTGDLGSAIGYASYNAAWTAGVTLPNVNSAPSGISCVANGTNNVLCTLLYREVDFTPAAGGFPFLITSLVGALLGPGVRLVDMPAIAALVRRRGRCLIQPHEYELAWRELRAHPFRAWSY